MYHSFPKIKIYSHNIVSIYTENLKRVMQKKWLKPAYYVRLFSFLGAVKNPSKNRFRMGYQDFVVKHNLTFRE